MPKDNLLFKLDNLEYQYHYANGDLAQFRPRLSGTAKLYNVKGKKTSKRVSKLLSELNLKQLSQQLDALRLQIFNNKVHYLEKNLRSLVLKNLTQYRPKKNAKNDFTPLIEKIRSEYGLEKFTELVCKSKAIKLSVSKIVPSNKATVPIWFENHVFWNSHNDKTDEFNPSRIWNEVLLPNKFDQLVSTFMNNDKCRSLFSTFDSGMNMFLGINRDAGSGGKVEQAQEDAGIVNEKNKTSILNTSDQERSQDANDSSEPAVELDEDLLKQYDGLLGDSDEEDAVDAAALDPNIDYNEVTDEEPDQDDDEVDDEVSDLDSDSDSDSEKVNSKAQLPELMAGYYSGDDSYDGSDSADDKVAREQISTKEKKKNRRGQRARRKIWEKKYGREAKHIQREVEKEHLDRKRRQEEYEERVAKRAAKAVTVEARKTETARQNAIKSSQEKEKSEHPSWIAKRDAEEKLKNSKFQGKKITFD